MCTTIPGTAVRYAGDIVLRYGGGVIVEIADPHGSRRERETLLRNIARTRTHVVMPSGAGKAELRVLETNARHEDIDQALARFLHEGATRSGDETTAQALYRAREKRTRTSGRRGRSRV